MKTRRIARFAASVKSRAVRQASSVALSIAVLAALPALLAVGLLAAPGAAQAQQILIDNPFQNFGIGFTTGGTANDQNDGLLNFTTSSAFTVSTGANVLVAQFDEAYQNGDTPNIAVTWDGMSLTLASSVSSSNVLSHILCEIWYLNNPPAASSALTVTGTGRSLSLGAFSLSGVNTNIAPAAYTMDTTSGSSSLVTLSGATAAGSFAAVAEGLRVKAVTNTPFTLTASSGTATQQWTVIDLPNNDFQYGGGVITNLSAGASTVTQSNHNSDGSRNEIAVAVFTPAVATASGFIWSGTASNSWDNSTANWSGGTLGSVYKNGLPVTFSDSGKNTSIVITSSGVSPASVLFLSNTAAYSLSSGAISGTASVTLSGTGLVTFNNANTYTGSTTINSGTLLLANANAVQQGSAVLNAAANGLAFAPGIGTFNLSGLSGSGSLAMSDTTGAAVTLQVGGNGATSAFPGLLSGNGSLTKAGSGTLTLSNGGNSYSGVTTISGGVLSIAGTDGATNGSLGAVPATATPAAITLNGGTIQFTTGSAEDTATISNNRGITLGASGGTINVASVSSGTLATAAEIAMQYRGVISGSGNLTVSGGAGVNSGTAPYILELGAQNTYTGTTTVNNAVVGFNNGYNGGGGPNNILPPTTVLSLVNNGWFTFDNGASSQTIAGLSGDATGRLATTNGTSPDILTITPSAGSTYTFAGVIGVQSLLNKTNGSNAEISLVIDGPGMQILSGANTYTGATTISAGTLQIGGGGVLGGGSYPGNISNSGMLVIGSSANQTLSGVISGNGSLTAAGPGILVLTASNTFTGATTISGGTLLLANANAAQQSAATVNAGNGLTFASGIGTFNLAGLSGSGSFALSDTTGAAVTLQVGGNNASTIYSGNLGGIGALTLVGSGVMTLSGSNTYAGPTTISGGTLQLSYGGVVGGGNYNAAIADNGALVLNSSGNQVLGGAISGSGSLVQLGSGVTTLSGSSSYGGTLIGGGTLQLVGGRVVSGGTVTAENGAAISLSGNASLSSGTVTADNGGAISLTGNGSLSALNQFIGNSAAGSAAQSGGTSSISGALYLGYLAGSSGTYSLGGSGTPVLSANSESLGYSGTGAVTQSGGFNTVGSSIYLGYNAGSSGAYNLSGSGQLSAAGTLIVGYSGAATFTQSGGTNLPGALYLGYFAGSSGTYSLAGGLLSASYENVGASGAGTFIQSGGTNGSSNSLSLYLGGNAGGAPGTLGLGTYNLSGSGLVSASSETVAAGTFTQSGGTNSMSGSLLLDGSAGNNAAYSLSGSGQVSANIEFLGEFGQGAFSHSGGTNTVGSYLYLGYLAGGSGTYSLNGGQLSAPSEYVGYSGSGSFSQPAGTNVAGSLYLGGNTGGSGTYGLSGSGRLSASYVYVTGAFTQSGGTNSISGLLLLGNNASGAPGTPGPSTYALSGSGRLSAPYEFVGGSGAGAFTQSGGINSVGSALALGSGGSGAYNLSSSGQLSAPYEYVGGPGAGIFTQSGGTNAISGELYVGNGLAGGTYNLNGGLLVLPALGQGAGPAAFNFNGGTLLAGSGFSSSLPMRLGASGAIFDTAGYAVTLSGSLSGPGGLTKVDSGMLSLAAANTYSGNTLISGGTLTAAVAGALSASSAVSVGYSLAGGGVLDVTAAPQSVSALSITASGVLYINVQKPLAVGNTATFAAGSTLNISGSIATLPELLMTYTAVSGTFSNVTFNGVSLPNGDILAYGPGALDIVSEGSPAVLAFNSNGSPGAPGSTVTVLNGAHTISTPVEIEGGSLEIVLSNSGGLNISGNISDDSFSNDNGRESLTLAGDGSGQLLLSGTDNTYGGGTIVEAGTLVVNNRGALPAGSSLTVGAGGIFGFDPSESGLPVTTSTAVADSSATGVAPVPEPCTLALLAAGAALLLVYPARSKGKDRIFELSRVGGEVRVVESSTF